MVEPSTAVSERAATPPPPDDRPQHKADPAADLPLVEADLLIEDVSIDGMCGVY